MHYMPWFCNEATYAPYGPNQNPLGIAEQKSIISSTICSFLVLHTRRQQGINEHGMLGTAVCYCLLTRAKLQVRHPAQKV